MNVVSYLASILTKAVRHDAAIDQLLKGQQQIMATLQELQDKVAAQAEAIASVPPVLESLGAGIVNVAADIQALKDQIGQAPVGITPEEADGVVAGLDANLVALNAAKDGLVNAAAALQSVADAQ